jgi:hypothetical protein
MLPRQDRNPELRPAQAKLLDSEEPLAEHQPSRPPLADSEAKQQWSVVGPLHWEKSPE